MRKVNLSPAIYVTLALRQKSAADKVIYGNNIVGMMTNNINFSQPEPSLASYQATINNLSAAMLAVDTGGSIFDKQNLDNAESDFDRETGRMRDYVQNVAWANTPNIAKEIILSAGMLTRKAREKASVPPAISRFSAIYTNETGTVLTKWKGVKYARTYIVYAGTSADETDGTWTIAGITALRKLMVINLKSGVRYYFKVVAVGVKGNSPASTIATTIAA